jgi:Domain of unknown function (DUF4124)
MRTTLLILALLAGPALAGQTVWKWVDANGVTHYADRPVPGAVRMEIGSGNTSNSSTPSSSDSPSPTATTASDDTGPVYRNFEIWKPGPNETVANTGGQVSVDVRVEPSLQPGDTLSLYLDGRLIDGYPGNTLSFDLTDVPRGTHSLVAVITNSAGARIQETPSVTFFVRQESAAQPPVGPALRPPPKPQPRGASNKMPTSQPTYLALNNVRAAPIDPATNRPVVTKPASAKPVTPGPRQGK